MIKTFYRDFRAPLNTPIKDIKRIPTITTEYEITKNAFAMRV